eukprot:scaffold303813_cov27-Tisochrysis_lutea.AAC.1
MIAYRAFGCASSEQSIFAHCDETSSTISWHGMSRLPHGSPVRARASVEVKSGSQPIGLPDVQSLLLWSLLGSEVTSCPRWAFVK